MSSQFAVQAVAPAGSQQLNIANRQMSELSQLDRALAEQGVSLLLCRVGWQHQYPGERYFFSPGVETNIVVDVPEGVDLDALIKTLPSGGDKRHTVPLHFFSIVEDPELTASLQILIDLVEIRTTADIGRGVTFPDSDYTILDVVVEGAANFAPTDITEGDEVIIIVASAAVLAMMDGPLFALQNASRQPVDFLDCAGAFS